MALIQESYLLHLLNECDAYSTRLEKELKQAVIKRLQQIYKILKRNIRQTFTNFSLDVIVRFTEISVQIQEKLHYAEQFVDLFFQRIQAPSQFYIRQLLVKAKVITLKGLKNQEKGQQILKTLKSSISYINKALDLISGPQQTVPQKGKDPKGGSGGDNSKSKYGFLVYNASTCLYKITRFLLRSSWQKNFTQIYQRIYKLFQELDQQSHNWRCRFSLILFQCLYDSDKKPDAFKVLDSLWEKTRTKHCDFQDSLFKLRVHLSKQNNALAAVIKKDIETNPTLQWGALQILQKMKSGAIPQAQIQKQLMTIVNTIHDGILSTNEQASTILSPIKQQRLAEAGRIALKYNIISIASSITNFLSKARQPSQKAMVLNEYNKAELLIKKKGEFIDKKTGMMMSNQQIKTLEIQYRKESLKILEKVMIINKKLDNADLIYEGAVLIWNISLPFMCSQYRSVIVKPFQISALLLQQIDSIDHDLRTKMHLELAKIFFGNETMFIQVESNIMKAIKLDPSIPLQKINVKFQSSEDLSLYQRPYERYLEDFREKILLKTMQNIDPNPLDTITQDLWNVADQKSQTTRIDILQKCLKTLLTLEEPQFNPKEEDMLVEEQINQKRNEFERKKLIQYKRKKQLAAEVAEFAFEWDLNDFAKKACELVLADNWESKNSIELIISQSKCCYFMAQIKIDELTNENFQFCFQNPKKINDEDTNHLVDQSKQTQVSKKKSEIIEYLKKGLKLAQSIQQYWLIFNGSIYLWNNCLHIFRNPSNDPELKGQLIALLQVMFDSMKKSLAQIQVKNIVYYDLDTKIQTFANIGLVFARIKQLQKKPDDVLKICQSLLSTSLSPHTRKLINGIKARIQKNGGGKAPDNKKGGKDAPAKTGSNDSFLLDIITQLQVIQNSTNKTQSQNLIKKCYQNLQQWKPKEQDEPQLQLHAQLWVRLARLAINQQTINMYKFCLRCCEYSLFYLDTKSDIGSLPINRLRWYSLGQFLYSECLMKICNPETQQASSVQKIRFSALQKAVQAAQKGYKCNISALVLDAAKQVWNISIKLQQTQTNRAKLMLPIKNTLFYLKQMKQDSQIDLILLLSELYFRAALQNNEYAAGQDMVDMVLSLVPKNLQKSLWQAKMIFMSKQGKNQLHAISSIKQADPSLQAKLWVRLARVSIQPTKQHMAYNKALDILKKEHSVEIVQVLMEYAEWQSRVGHQNLESIKSTLLLASDYLIDIEFGQDEEQQQPEEQKGTVFSRSTRGKKSVASKSMKSAMKTNQSKKPNGGKGPLSLKSKGASSSRMNRSGRVTKTAKSKNTKSIFSQKQEDPNPQNLNCLHFERLFRIHTTLALISESQQQKIRYALDAQQFLVKMYHLSIKTLNEMLENAGKFSEKNEKKDIFKPVPYPKGAEDWIKIDLSKEYIERINNFQNFNFMGAYTFEKPQLTFAYLNHLLSIFDQYGLSLHSLPVNFLSRYIARYILKNQLLYTLMNLKLKRTLTLANSVHIQEANSLIDFQSLKISDSEFNKEVQKAQNSKIYEKNENIIFQSNPQPSLVKPISNYEIWTQIAQQLIEEGRLSLAKKFLQKAQLPSKILLNNVNLSKILKGYAKIYFFQGDFSQSIVRALEANKICKSMRIWPDLILVTCQSLLQLQKYQNAKRFLNQIYDTLIELIEQSKQVGNNNKSNFQTEILALKQTLILIRLLKSYQKITEITVDEATLQNISQFLSLMASLKDSIFNQKQAKFTVRNFNLFILLAREVFKIFARGGGPNTIEMSFNIFTWTFDMTLKIEMNVLQINKYCMMSEGKVTDNLINHIHREIRYLLVEGYQIKELLQESSTINTQENDTVDQLQNQNQILRKYLDTLKRQIQKSMCPISTNLRPAESAIAILENLKLTINKQSYEYIRWFSYYTLSQTLRALSKEQLVQIWNDKISLEQMSSQYGVISLQTMQSFLEECQPKLNNYEKDLNCFLNSERSYLSLINNCGMQLPDRCFEYMAKYQHACYTQNLVQILNKNIQPTHKSVCNSRILNNSKVDSQIRQTLIKSDLILQSYSKFSDYQQVFALLPLNSLTLIIQLSRSKTQIYFGCYINSSNPQERKFIVKKKQLLKSEFKSLISIKKSFNNIKKNILKTPFQNHAKIASTIQQNEKDLVAMNGQFQDLNKWWLYQVVQQINKPKQTNAEQVDTAAKDKDKKGGKEPPKKPGAKEEVGTYESPLPATPSGIQSATFLLDDFFYSLPFEHLSGFQNVPAVSKDNSIFYLARKLSALNFQPKLNNSNGFGSDKGKFLAYDFKDESLNFSSILPASKSTNLKVNGISSTQRVPSPGDLVQYLSTGGFIQIYGNISLLNRFKIQTFINCINKTNNFLILAADNLNYRKQVQIKYVNLVQGSDISLQNQEQILIAVLNLLNINLVKLRWNSDEEKTKMIMQRWYDKLNNGYYIGNLDKFDFKTPEKQVQTLSIFNKLSTFIHGSPILRL